MNSSKQCRRSSSWLCRRLALSVRILLSGLLPMLVAAWPAPLRAQIVSQPLPLLQLEITLGWTPVYALDPLPVSLRLFSPQARMNALQWLDANEGSTNSPATPSLVLASNWAAGLELTLVRQGTNGQETVVLSGSQWGSYFLAPHALIADFENELAVRSRQWWVPSAAVQLTPGNYRLDARWIGTNYTDSYWLPPNGVVSASARFSVLSPTTDSEKAAHAERIALEEYRKGNLQAARDQALEALRLAPGLDSAERFDTYLLASTLALQLQDIKTSVFVMQDLLGQVSEAEIGGLRSQLERNVDTVRPRLELSPMIGQTFRVVLHGMPDQPYSISASSDLQTWALLSTARATNGLILVEDSAGTNAARRFYRSQWVP